MSTKTSELDDDDDSNVWDGMDLSYGNSAIVQLTKRVIYFVIYNQLNFTQF